MRVLITSASHCLTDYLPVGEGVICYNLIKHLAELGCEIHALAPNIKVKKAIENVTFYSVGKFACPPRSAVERDFGPVKFGVFSFFKSMSLLKQETFDLIHHIRPFYPGIECFDLVSALARRRPFVIGPASLPWEVLPEEVEYEEGVLHPSPRPIKCAQKTISILLWALMRKLKLFERTVKNCDALLVTTKKLKPIFGDLVDERKIRVVPDGVDTNFFKPPPESFESNFHEILTISRLIKGKGLEYIIRAMPIVSKEYPNATLKIVGKGSHEEGLKGLVRKLKIEKRVTFEEVVPHQRIIDRYWGCEIFCLPSPGEPFPQVVLEAMACGKPIIAVNAGGLPEIIDDKKSGLLVPPRNHLSLAMAIIRLFENEKLRVKIGEKAREVAERRFSWKVVSAKVFRIYNELL